MGIVSLILGIIAIIIDIATLGTGGIVSVILGVIGIIFGALGRKKAEGQGIATGRTCIINPGRDLRTDRIHRLRCMCSRRCVTCIMAR